MQIPDLRQTLKTPEDVYKHLGQYIMQHINEEWTRAWIEHVIEAESVDTTKGEYITPANETKTFPTGFEISMAMRILRDLIKKEGASQWSKAVFKLTRDGTLDLQITYPDAPTTDK